MFSYLCFLCLQPWPRDFETAPCCDPTSRIENRFRVGSTFVLLLNVSERHFADVNESEG